MSEWAKVDELLVDKTTSVDVQLRGIDHVLGRDLLAANPIQSIVDFEDRTTRPFVMVTYFDAKRLEIFQCDKRVLDSLSD